MYNVATTASKECIVNCTPHPINLYDGKNIVKVYEPSGILPRVKTQRVVIGHLKVTETTITPINSTIFGGLENLPEPKDGVWYIVSAIVANAAPHRRDLLIPDDAVRDDQGRIIGCRAFGMVSAPSLPYNSENVIRLMKLIGKISALGDYDASKLACDAMELVKMVDDPSQVDNSKIIERLMGLIGEMTALGDYDAAFIAGEAMDLVKMMSGD